VDIVRTNGESTVLLEVMQLYIIISKRQASESLLKNISRDNVRWHFVVLPYIAPFIRSGDVFRRNIDLSN
jgi:hypothetical protein